MVGEQMKTYKISGKIKKLKQSQNFTIESIGKTEKEALERVYSLLGSKHHVTRKYVLIDEVEVIPKEDVTDPYVLFQLKKVQ